MLFYGEYCPFTTEGREAVWWKMHPNILTPWQVFTVSEKKVLWGKVNVVTGQVNALSFPEGFSLIWAAR